MTDTSIGDTSEFTYNFCVTAADYELLESCLTRIFLWHITFKKVIVVHLYSWRVYVKSSSIWMWKIIHLMKAIHNLNVINKIIIIYVFVFYKCFVFVRCSTRRWSKSVSEEWLSTAGGWNWSCKFLAHVMLIQCYGKWGTIKYPKVVQYDWLLNEVRTRVLYWVITPR